MDRLDTFMNTIIFIAGAYLIYSAVIMKVKGEVSSVLLGKGIDWSRAKEDNKKAYLKIMTPANLITGIVMLGIGLLFTFEDRLGIQGIGDSLLLLAGLVVCIVYGSLAMHTQNRYLK